MQLRQSFIACIISAGFVLMLASANPAHADDYSNDYDAAGDFNDGRDFYGEDVPGDNNAMPGLTKAQQKSLAEVEKAYDKLLGPAPKLSAKAEEELNNIWSKGEENLTKADEKRIAQLLGPIPKLTSEQQKQLEALDRRYDAIMGKARK
jgi:hypothetical protein